MLDRLARAAADAEGSAVSEGLGTLGCWPALRSDHGSQDVSI